MWTRIKSWTVEHMYEVSFVLEIAGMFMLVLLAYLI
jgi:hypothetical protein